MTNSEEIQKIISKMPEAFRAEKAANLQAIIQLDLSGEGGGCWMFEFAEGDLTIEEGQSDTPNLTLNMAAEDFVALSYGRVTGTGLFMGGRLQFKGDVGLAMKFQEMFDRQNP